MTKRGTKRPPLTRSEVMARVRGKNTSPEIAVRKALWAAGLRYRLHRKLPGTPDLAFVGVRVAVFVDGCFWHGCPQHYSSPSTRPEFWAAKLRRNVLRDQRVDAELADQRWTALRFWEHDIKQVGEIVRRIERVVRPEVAAAEALELREPTIQYQAPPPTGPWYGCSCGGRDVRVIEVSGPGGLSPRSKRPIERATLLCRECGRERTAQVRFSGGPSHV